MRDHFIAVSGDAARTENRIGELTRESWLPDTVEDAAAGGVTDIDTLEAVRYYRAERGGNEYSTDRRLSPSDPLLLGYDAFHLVDPYENGTQLWEMAPDPVDLMVIDGAGHYEIYDEAVNARSRLGRCRRRPWRDVPHPGEADGHIIDAAEHRHARAESLPSKGDISPISGEAVEDRELSGARNGSEPWHR